MEKSFDDLLAKLEKTKIRVRQEKADFITNLELQRENYNEERRLLINKINELRRKKMKVRSETKESSDQNSTEFADDKIDKN